MKNLKGQAAMEYLMTYGWALLAIIIVIAALLYLNPFRAPEMYLFQQQGFSCSEPNAQVYVDADNQVNMNVRIWNKLGKSVYIKGIACTDSQSAKFTMDSEAVKDYSDVQIPTGDYADFSTSSEAAGGEILCYHSDGTPINDMSVNQEFRGRLMVWYNYVDDLDQDIQHEAQANVISLIVQQ